MSNPRFVRTHAIIRHIVCHQKIQDAIERKKKTTTTTSIQLAAHHQERRSPDRAVALQRETSATEPGNQAGRHNPPMGDRRRHRRRGRVRRTRCRRRGRRARRERHRVRAEGIAAFVRVRHGCVLAAVALVCVRPRRHRHRVHAERTLILEERRRGARVPAMVVVTLTVVVAEVALSVRQRGVRRVCAHRHRERRRGARVVAACDEEFTAAAGRRVAGAARAREGLQRRQNTIEKSASELQTNQCTAR